MRNKVIFSLEASLATRVLYQKDHLQVHNQQPAFKEDNKQEY